MPDKTGTRHRGTHWALVDGSPPSELFDRYPPSRTSISLTESREAVRRARQAADTFHTFDITSLDGTPMHVVHAHYKADRTDAVFGGHAVTYIFEINTDAVLASFGLGSRPAPPAA